VKIKLEFCEKNPGGIIRSPLLATDLPALPRKGDLIYLDGQRDVVEVQAVCFHISRRQDDETPISVRCRPIDC